MAEQYARLRIEALRGGPVREVVNFLSALEEAYNNLYAIDFYLSRLEVLGDKIAYYPRFSHPIPFERIQSLVLPEDVLMLDSVVIQSPGWWSVIGSLNPIETLRKYLNDRHERQKDREYRNQHEEEKLRLENEKLKIEVFTGRLEALREIGFNEEELRRILIEHGANPLSSLCQLPHSSPSRK